jgi:hypothetical protein
MPATLFESPSHRPFRGSRSRVLALICGLLAPAAALSGCGPSLQFVDRHPVALAVEGECSQGPFVIERSSLGGRWGEQFEVHLVSSRPVAGELDLRVDGKTVRRQRFHTAHEEAAERGATRSVADRVVGNDHCLERPGVLVVEAAPVAGEPVVSEPVVREPVVSGPVAGGTATVEAVIAAPPSTHAPARLVASTVTSGAHYTHLVSWRVAVETIDGTAVAAGLPISLRIWSAQPIDWSGTVFVVHHAVAKPSVKEAEWVAHLEEKKREADLEQAQRQREWEAGRAKRQAEAAKSAAKRAARAERCRTHLEDEDCWGRGGYQGWRKQQEAANARRRAEQAPAPQVCTPDGPPPLAPVEVSSPPPTAHAAWVAGYYGYGCDGWYWLQGWWRVPERDLRVEVAVQAPSGPPPLQVEVATSCPVHGAIWVAGSWLWSSGSWVWVRGRWALPPSGQARWRPTLWVKLPGGTVRLDPGRWEIRLGR